MATSSSKSSVTKVVARDNQTSATEEGVSAGSNGAGNVLGNDYTTSGGLTVSGIRAGGVSSSGVAGLVGVALKGLYGSITINANGTYTYVVDNTNAVVNALAKGENLQETFTYTATNGAASAQAAIVVKVNGANDAATITGVASGAVVEDGASATATGKLTVSDVDRGENVVKATTQSGEYGKFSINADGTWNYVLNNKSGGVQSLAQGETVTEKFVVTSKDGTASQTVVVTVTGTNDVPKIEGSNRATLTEDGHRTVARGEIEVHDRDDGQSSVQVVVNQTGTYGSFSVDAGGHWKYTMDNSLAATQALAQGEKGIDSFVVYSKDGSASQTVTVTINGVNDQATITGQDTGSVNEDANPNTATGKLIVNDVDNGENTVVPVTDKVGAFGSFSIAADGAWTYSLNNGLLAVQSLAAGATLTETFVVYSQDSLLTSADHDDNDEDEHEHDDGGRDEHDDGDHHDRDDDEHDDDHHEHNDYYGASKVVTVTIVGTNDAAVIVGSSTGAVTEDLTLGTSGQLSVTDVDTGESSFQAQDATAGAYGSFSIDAAGQWAYSLNNGADNVQALAANEIATEAFTVRSFDGTEKTVTITVTGTNDAATISGTSTGDVTEDTALTTSGVLIVADVDHGETVVQPQTDAVGTFGSFSIAADGTWNYTVNNVAANVQALAKGEQVTDTFNVVSKDGTASQVVTVTLTGTNDAPVITSTTAAATGAVAEDGTALASGQLTASDVDSGATQTWSVQGSADGTYGSIAIDAATGQWTYNLNNGAANVQALAAGETHTETFTVRVTDDQGATAEQQVSVIVTGSNDGPTGAATVALTAGTEDTAYTVTASDLLAGFSDVDNGAVLSVSGLTASDGTVTDNGDGTFTVSPSANFNGDVTLSYDVVDSQGGSVASALTYTVDAVNDVATISGDSAAAVVEDTSTRVGGTLTVSDVDAGEAHTQAITKEYGTYGGLSVDADGNWVYDLAALDRDGKGGKGGKGGPDEAAMLNTQALAEGETATDTFTVTSQDGTATKDITITVTGTNDNAYVYGDTFGAVSEDSDAGTAIGKLYVSDVDHGEAHTQVSTQQNSLGTFNVDGDGNWAYQVDNNSAIVQSLAEGMVAYERVNVTSLDGTFIQTVEINITGTNDGPTGAATAVLAAGTEDAAYIVYASELLAGFSDVDYGDVLSVAGLSASNGTVTDNGDTSFTITPTANFNGVVILNYNVVDSFGSSIASSLSYTLDSVNDGPVVTNTTAATLGAVTEDTTTVASGQLSVSDVDAGATQAWSVQGSTAGTYGSIAVNAVSGQWIYNLNNGAANVQALAAGENHVEAFTVRVTDDQGASVEQQVNVTVTGSNDGPVIAAQAGAVETLNFESGTYSDGQYLHVSDGYGGFNWSTSHSTYNAITYGVAADILGGSNAGAASGSGAAWNGYASKFSYITLQDSGTFNFEGASFHKFHIPANQIKLNGYNDGVLKGSEIVNLASSWQSVSSNLKGIDQLVIEVTSGTQSGNGVSNTGWWGMDDFKYSLNSGAQVAVVNEDATLSATGQLTATDVDNGATQSWSVSGAANGAYGAIGIDAASGQWTYNLNNSAANVQALAAGETQTETFTLRVTDDQGATADQNVSVVVTGANDGPTGAATATLAAGTEDSAYTVSASSLLAGFSDVDNGDTLSVSGLTASNGSLVNNGNGTYTITPTANFNGAVTLNYNVVDGKGGSVAATQNYNLAAVNDVPVAVGDSNGSDAVIESNALNNFAGDPTAVGNVLTNDTDVDAGDAKTVSAVNGVALNVGASIVGTYGAVIIASDGSYTYTLDNNKAATNALPQGAKVNDVFNYTVVDAAGATSTTTLSIGITGTNDRPVAGYDQNYTDPVKEAGIGAGGVVVAGDATAVGNVLANDTDADTGSVITLASFLGSAANIGATIQGTYGSIVLSSNGDYTYTLDNTKAATNALAQGATGVDAFDMVYISDEYGRTFPSRLHMVVSGTNDAPTGTATTVLAHGTEDTAYTVSVADLLAGFSDVDTGSSISISGLTASNGTVIANPNGTYTITPTANFNGQVTLSYNVVDGLGGSVAGTQSYTLAAIDDAPKILFSGQGGTITTNGSDIIHSYTNIGSNQFVAADVEATAQVLVVGGGGGGGAGGGGAGGVLYSTSFALNSGSQHQVLVGAGGMGGVNQGLAQGGTNGSSSSFDAITAFGGGGGGAFRAAGLSGASSGGAGGDTAVATGAATQGYQGANGAANEGYVASGGGGGAGGVGTRGLYGADGYGWATASSPGGNGGVGVTNSITGTSTYYGGGGGGGANTNAAPTTIGGVGGLGGGGAGATSNYGQGSAGVVSTGGGGGGGDAEGSGGAGGSGTVVVRYTLSSAQYGNTDSASAAFMDTAATDGFVSTNGLLLAADTENSTLTYGISGGAVSGGLATKVGDYGTLVINTASGAYTFTPNSASINALTSNASESFVLTASDGANTTSGTYSVLVSGVNDSAAISGTSTGTVQEDTTLTTGGTLTVGDVDAGQALVQAQTNVVGAHGTFNVDASGQWTYTLDNSAADIQSLNTGSSLTDSLTVFSLDGTASKVLTVNIAGLTDNRAPVAVNDAMGSGSGAVNFNLLTNDTDPDAGSTLSVNSFDALSASGVAISVVNGLATMNTSGSAAYKALTAGQTLLDTFTYDVKDQFGVVSNRATATYTLVGVNDVATMTGDQTGSVKEDGTLTASGRLVVTDPDSGQSSVRAQSVSGTYGTFNVDVNGNWTYNLNNTLSAVQALAQGETVTQTYSVVSTDGTATKTVTVSIAGTNDAPVGVNDTKASGSITFESGTYTQTSGTVGSYTGAIYTTNDGFKFYGVSGGYVNLLNNGYGANNSSMLYDYGSPMTPAIVMVRVDNSTFSIGSANITGYYGNSTTSPYSYTETVKGYLNGALVAQESFSVPVGYYGGANIAVHPFAAAGFANVDRVEFTQTTNNSYTYQFLDNIQVPSTTAAAADIKVLINDTDIDHNAVVTINQVAATSAMGAAVSLNTDGSLHYNPLVSSALTSLAQRDSVTDVVMYTPKDQYGAVGNQAAVYINLTGTVNTNVFAIHTGDSVHTIKSFNAAANGDVLNLQDLLSTAGVTSAHLAEYVQLTTVGSNTVVMVDADGTGAGAAVQVATLTGVTGLLLANLDTNHNVVYA